MYRVSWRIYVLVDRQTPEREEIQRDLLVLGREKVKSLPRVLQAVFERKLVWLLSESSQLFVNRTKFVNVKLNNSLISDNSGFAKLRYKLWCWSITGSLNNKINSAQQKILKFIRERRRNLRRAFVFRFIHDYRFVVHFRFRFSLMLPHG